MLARIFIIFFNFIFRVLRASQCYLFLFNFAIREQKIYFFNLK